MTAPVLELRAQAGARNVARFLAPQACFGLVGVGFLMVARAPGVRDEGLSPLLVTFGVLVLVVALLALAQRAAGVRRQVILRLDDDGVHLRRARGFVDLPWDRVARVHLAPIAITPAPRDGAAPVLVHWVPVDDRDLAVTDKDLEPLERALPLPATWARLATLFTRQRSAELLALVAWVAEHVPAVEVVDGVLGTAPVPPVDEHAPRVAIVSQGLSHPLVPQVVAALRRSGRAPVVVASATDTRLDAALAALGAGVAMSGTDGGPDVDALNVAVEGCEALVVLGQEDAAPQVDGVRQVVVSRTPEIALRQVERSSADTVVVLASRLLESPPVGTVDLSRELDPDAVPVTSGEVAALVVALLDGDLTGLVQVTGGDAPIADAVSAVGA